MTTRRASRSAHSGEEREEIDLLRGGSIVKSLAGAFGSGLRETRLTTMLGYAIALCPNEFCELFGFSGVPHSVSLETRHADDRSDILVETSDGKGVIEAKVGSHDPFEQASKYGARWMVLLTEHQPTKREQARKCLYRRWRDLVPVLDRLRKSNHAAIRFINDDLKLYLEEHNMIPKSQSIEIYARMLNDVPTADLFLRGQMYGDKYKAGSPLAKALYFAPHFGQAVVDKNPAINHGISYIAKIETVEVVESFHELCDRTAHVKGKKKFNENKDLLQQIKWWFDKGGRMSFVFLGKPQLVFNPAIRMDTLQKGGWHLRRQFYSFEEFFCAWGNPPLK